ncbi:MAG: DUF4920 domain-containing protein [Acidobacteriota bacterium]
MKPMTDTASLFLRFAVGLAVASLLALPATAAEDHHQADAVSTEFGAGGGEGEIVAIADILGDAAAWEGREVRVSGEITGVCQIAGCWIEIDDGGGTLRLKVNDGDIVFPTAAQGHQAIARGVVERRELDRERYVGWKQHLADELGEEFDPASVGDGPYVIVQLRGLGATVDGDVPEGDLSDTGTAEG